MSDNTATFIAPDHFGPVNLKPGMTIADALEKIGQDGESIVKLDGTQKELGDNIVAGAVYLVVPGKVVKGGFDGGLNLQRFCRNCRGLGEHLTGCPCTP